MDDSLLAKGDLVKGKQKEVNRWIQRKTSYLIPDKKRRRLKSIHTFF
jgi:hypothetical protein